MNLRRDDRGAVLIIVAVFALVAVLMLAFVVDIGGLRQEKKEVTLSTDAAALAVAAQLDLRTFDPGTYECDEVPLLRDDSGDPIAYAQTVADDYLSRNGSTTGEGCRVEVTGPRRGYVVIGGREDVDYALSGVVGQDSGTVRGVSASVARVDFGGGLRPLGLCASETTINEVDGEPYDLTEDVLEGSTDDEGYLDSEIDAVIALDHLDRDSGCSVQAPGRRGQLNLDESQNGNGGNNRCSNPNPDPQDADAGYFTSEYRFGYQGEVLEWTLSDGGADFKGLEDCFKRDILGEQLIWLPIFDAYDPPPESRLRIVAFAQAQLTGYCISNAKNYAVPASIGCLADIPGENGAGKPWLRLTISRVVDFGDDGPPLTDDALRGSPAICAEKDDVSLLANCVPPNPPPRGTPSDPNPPSEPVAECAGSEATLDPEPTLHPTKSGELDGDVTATVTLTSDSDCGAADIRVVRVSTGAVLAPRNPCCDVTETTYEATFRAKVNGWTWAAGSYRLELFDSSGVLSAFDFSLP